MAWARAASLAVVVAVVVWAMTHNTVPVCAVAAVAVRPIDGSDSDLELATQFRATVRIVAEQVDKVCGLLG